MPPMMKTNEQLLETLESKTIKTDSCWLWQGKLDSNGYGHISFRGKHTRIHRASAYLFLGLDLWDETQQVNHKITCFRTDCWNPEHLYVGTPADNARDRMITGGKETCPQGHSYDMINSRGRRDCSICRKESMRKSNAKRKMPPLSEQ